MTLGFLSQVPYGDFNHPASISNLAILKLYLLYLTKLVTSLEMRKAEQTVTFSTQLSYS
jgi:hypothetical protein